VPDCGVRVQLPVISSKRLQCLLEFCHIVHPTDSPSTRLAKLKHARNVLHAMGAAFWFSLPDSIAVPITEDDDNKKGGKEENEEDEDDEEGRKTAEKEEGEKGREMQWLLVADVPWLLAVLARTLDEQTDLAHNSTYTHKQLCYAWTEPPSNKGEGGGGCGVSNGEAGSSNDDSRGFVFLVPPGLLRKTHALLESIDVLWAPRSKKDEGKKNMKKAYSYVLPLLSECVPQAGWARWEKSLGRPAHDRFEGEMMIDKIEVELAGGLGGNRSNLAGPAETCMHKRNEKREMGDGQEQEQEQEESVEEKEEEERGVEGEIQFERWWIFAFLPVSFFARFVVLLLRTVRGAPSLPLSCSRRTRPIRMETSPLLT